MPELDVAPLHLQTVQAILAHHIPDRTVWAFGSRVHGTARPASDLDLVILGSTRLPLQTRTALRNDLEESPLPYPIDLIEWAAIKPRFRQIIEQAYIVVQDGKRGKREDSR